MSALAFLGGLSQGAGDEYARIADQKRLLTNSNNQALADTIHQRLETDNTLDWPTYSSLRAQEYKLRGVPTGDAQQLIQHEKGVFDTAQQSKNQTFQAAPQNQVQSPPTNPGNPLAALQPSLPPSPSLQGPPATTGDVRTHAQIANQQALFEAQIAKQREQLGLINGPGGPTGGIDENGHYYITSGLGANGNIEVKKNYESGTHETAPVDTDEILSEDPNAKDLKGHPLVPHTWATRTRFKGSPTEYEASDVQSPTKQTVFLSDPGQWAEVRLDPKNRIIGTPQFGVPAPAGYVGKSSSQISDQWKIDPNTNQLIKVQVGTQRNTVPILPGQGNPAGSPTGPVPSITKASVAPAIAPQLIGGVAKTSALGPAGDNRSVIRVPAKGSPFDITNPLDRKAFFEGIDTKLADAIKLPKGLNNAYANRLSELEIIPNDVDNAARERSLLATALLPHIDEVKSLIQEAKDKGEYGVLKSRWNDFLTGKIGEDTSQGKIFSRIATNLAFLGTATAMVHGGLRGGSSPGMIDHWDQAIKAPDPDTALQELSVVREWINGYKNIARNASAQTTNGTSLGPGTPTGAVPGQKQSLDEIFNGAK